MAQLDLANRIWHFFQVQVDQIMSIREQITPDLIIPLGASHMQSDMYMHTVIIHNVRT